MVGGEIHDLLRRARALERQRRLGENRAAASVELLQAVPSVGDVQRGIVAADAILAERLRQSRYLAPVELHAGADHEKIIGQGIIVLETNRVLLRLKGLGGVTNPTDADGDQVFLRTSRARQRIDTSADQRKRWLVVMVRRWLDDSDISTGRSALQDCCNCDAGSAPADDENLMVC